MAIIGLGIAFLLFPLMIAGLVRLSNWIEPDTPTSPEGGGGKE